MNKRFYLIIFGICFLTLLSTSKVRAAEKNEEFIGNKYEQVKFGDINTSRYISDNYLDESDEVIEKISNMNEYTLLKPITNSKYELALAHEDGSYEFMGSAETLDEAMEKVSILELEYDNITTIPTVIDENGQVTYATNTMGRIWNHSGNKPVSGTSVVTNIYSNSSLSNAYTYINQGYIDDVPVIEYNDKSAKILVNGYSGWINKNYASGTYDLVLVPINNVKNPSYYWVKDGSLYHYISYNMTDTNGANGYSIRIGKAPSYLNSGIKYYSYDGKYFYQGQSIADGLNKMINDLKGNVNTNAVNNGNPYYNYFQYLPFRTKTNYTAAEIDSFINSETQSTSKLRGLGSVLIECQNKYGVNPILTLAIAINESGWGMSAISQSKNNLFGINAVDSSPGQSADTYATPQDCVREFTKNVISRGYADPADWRYYGGYVGNKALGANVKYASDPFWGEKAAQHAYSLEVYLANGNLNALKDYDGYQLIVFNGDNQVKSKSGSLLYNINSSVSGWGGYAGNIAALKFSDINSNGKYEIFPDRTTPMNYGGEDNKFIGDYNWNNSAYINKEKILFANVQKTPFIPGYSKEDVDKDGDIDIVDLSTIALSYNNLNGYKKYLDLNSDGIIDIYDFTLISKNIK